MHWNLLLASKLAWRSLAHHRLVAVATVLGVALGVAVVGAILIVDFNTVREEQAAHAGDTRAYDQPVRTNRLQIVSNIRFERLREPEQPNAVPLPTQEGEARSGISEHAVPPVRRGEADYQTMRIAVRLASLLSFFVGAVIVFYTMRFSVVSRAREFCLVMCIGEYRRNVALSLLCEAITLGAIGAILGLLLSLPVAAGLLAAGLSTTGQVPTSGVEVPWDEMAVLGAIAVSIALCGVASPVRRIYRMDVARILQPRFLSGSVNAGYTASGFSWLIPPLIGASWLILRPFFQSWFSVVTFFFAEILVVLAISAATLWWTHPLLRGLMTLGEWVLKPLLPLETQLAARRMELSTRGIVLPVIAVSLVFSLLTGLHGVTRSLRNEVHDWAQRAVHPYSYFKAGNRSGDESAIQKILAEDGILLFRVSARIPGQFPMRLMLSSDVNAWLDRQDRPPLRPGTVVLSNTLAAHFDLRVGDKVIMTGVAGEHTFDVIAVADDIGFFAQDGRYVDLKSYALFSEGNPLFAGNLETTLGHYAMARPVDSRQNRLMKRQERALRTHFNYIKDGHSLGSWQVKEIDRDFLIFDFILLMTIVLAAIGVTNTMLIQVRTRQREFSVLRTVGMDHWQMFRMLLLEGLLIGLAGAILALIIGSLLAMVSVAFLDRFTLFEYFFKFSWHEALCISLLALFTCCVSSVYPALGAARISAAESLHYE